MKVAGNCPQDEVSYAKLGPRGTPPRVSLESCPATGCFSGRQNFQTMPSFGCTLSHRQGCNLGATFPGLYTGLLRGFPGITLGISGHRLEARCRGAISGLPHPQGHQDDAEQQPHGRELGAGEKVPRIGPVSQGPALLQASAPHFCHPLWAGWTGTPAVGGGEGCGHRPALSCKCRSVGLGPA